MNKDLNQKATHDAAYYAQQSGIRANEKFKHHIRNTYEQAARNAAMRASYKRRR